MNDVTIVNSFINMEIILNVRKDSLMVTMEDSFCVIFSLLHFHIS